MTAMAGSSRTLYQGSRDGWLSQYLSHANEHGAPTNAMWTDLVFNLFLLALASDAGGYFHVRAISNLGYLTFNVLNLNAGWIHRIDSGHVHRPWRAPTFLIWV
ncbi:MAG: APC family permease, partial [Paracoccaceae bacterium]|nr:APC family permease [Paracoccaceae bacterium]